MILYDTVKWLNGRLRDELKLEMQKKSITAVYKSNCFLVTQRSKVKVGESHRVEANK